MLTPSNIEALLAHSIFLRRGRDGSALDNSVQITRVTGTHYHDWVSRFTVVPDSRRCSVAVFNAATVQCAERTFRGTADRGRSVGRCTPRRETANDDDDVAAPCACVLSSGGSERSLRVNTSSQPQPPNLTAMTN